MKTHETTRPKTKCPHCVFKFFEFWNLKKHCQEKHPDLPFELEPDQLEWNDANTIV